MKDLRKAAEMALERLESHEYWMDERAIEALRQALSNEFNPDWNQVEALQESLREHMAEIQRLRQALAQPEQEPVAWVDITDEGKWSVRFAVPALSLPDGTKFYTAPPKREWVGLTYDEVYEFVCTTDSYIDFAKAIEAKLKEKNT